VKRRPLVGALAVMLALAPITGAAGCDTRSCTFVHGRQVDVSCDDVKGVVLSKTTAPPNSNNPSLVVETREGDVRVFLGEEYWNKYKPGDDYP
jgi:hypothetical protein